MSERALEKLIASGEIVQEEKTFVEEAKQSAFGKFTSSTVAFATKAATRLGSVAGGTGVAYAIAA